MCGVSGFVDFNGSLGVKDLEKSISKMRYRGPDGCGYKFEHNSFGCVGLAHVRLAVVGLSSDSSQPYSVDGISVVFNGEIYNFRELQLELKSENVTFVTDSESEVIVRAYQSWGLKCFAKFRGMFAIAISSKTKVILVRDRFGVKPLYMRQDPNGNICFASELGALNPYLGSKPELSERAISHFLRFGYVASDDCIFKEIKKVPAGMVLELNLATRKIFENEFWNAATAQHNSHASFSDAMNTLDTLISRSVRYRLNADVTVGVFLSGGIDSSLIAKAAVEESSYRIPTFTLGFDDPKYDETISARSIARYLGTDHYEYKLDSDSGLEIFSTIGEKFDEPFADTSQIPMDFLSKNVSQVVKAVMSADGGDELCAGYNKYKYVNSIKYFRVPKFVEKIGSKLQFEFFGERNAKIVDLILKSSFGGRMKSLEQFASNAEISRILIHDLQFRLDGDRYPQQTLESALRLDVEEFLSSDILVKVDRSTMRYGLEAREPLLDHDLYEFINGLPNEYKLKGRQQKRILKSLALTKFPVNLLKSKKMGFGVPILDWLNFENSNLFLEYLDLESLKKTKYFDLCEIDKILKSAKRGSKKNQRMVYNLSILSQWLRVNYI